MKYFSITHNTNAKEIGSFEQISELNTPLKKEVLDHFDKLKLSRRYFLEEMPPLDDFKLAEEAIITDILSNKFISMNIGFLINSKGRSILSNNNISSYQFFDVIISGIPYDEEFKLFYLLEEFEHINFEESFFQKTNLLGIKKEEVKKISTIEEFHNFDLEIQKNEHGLKLSFEKVHLNHSLDMLRLPGSSSIHISEKLKTQFEKIKLTGLKYKPSKIEFP